MENLFVCVVRTNFPSTQDLPQKMEWGMWFIFKLYFTKDVYRWGNEDTGWKICSITANWNLQINDFWLGVSKKVNNIILTSIKDTPFSKVTGVWLEKWAYHTHFKISKPKTEKGMAGSIFELYSCNFRK